MEKEITFSINKPKANAFVAILLILFGAGMAVAAFMNLIYDFSFSTLIVSLLLGGFGVWICYAVVVSMFIRGSITIDADGLEIIGVGISYKQELLWSEIGSMEVIRHPTTSERILQIKSTKSGLPVGISEKVLEDFDELLHVIKKYSEGTRTPERPYQKSAVPLASPVTEEDIDAIRRYCHYLAEQWWETNNLEEAVCDRCSSPLSRKQGFIIGSYLYCGNCARESFGPEAVYYLRSDPNFFGRGVLESAREFAKKEQIA